MVKSQANSRSLAYLLCLCIFAPAINEALLAESATKSREEIMIERLEAEHEIENIMSEYYWLHASDLTQAKDDLLALNTPGTRETMTGKIMPIQSSKPTSMTSPDGKKLVDAGGKKVDAWRLTNGFLHVHTECSPVIEISADGKTAKGTWVSPGLETNMFDVKPATLWGWMKLGADFVKESDGKWKIWHLQIYPLFMTPYDQSWAEVGNGKIEANLSKGNNADGAEAGAKAGSPSENGMKKSSDTSRGIYSPTAVYPDNQPMPPTPYGTFDEKTAY